MSAPEISRATEIGIAIITFDVDRLYTVTCTCSYQSERTEIGAEAVEIARDFDALAAEYGDEHAHTKEPR